MSPSDAHGNKFLKECGRKPVCQGAPSQKHFSDQGGGEKTHQSTQGLYKERSVVAKRQMQNNLHEKPDHDPSYSSSSSSSQTVPLLPNYYRTLKPTSVVLKLKGREVEGGLGFVLAAVRSCTEDLGLLHKAKTNIQYIFCFFISQQRMSLAWVQHTWRVAAGGFYAGGWG